MDNLWLDLRFALRTLARAPGFATVAVLTLGLGLGATSSILTVINAVLLSALPYTEPDRLVLVESALEQEGKVEILPVSYPDFADWRERNQVFEDLSMYSRQTFNLAVGDEPEVIVGEMASAGYFRMLGIEPLPGGRTFSPEEDSVPGGHPVVVLSHDFWRRRFGEDPALVGSTLTLSGISYQVLGVMPPGFKGLTDEAEIWVPMMMTSRVMTDEYLRLRGFRVFRVAGRLKPGISQAQAQAAMETIARDLEREHSWHNKDIGARVVPLREAWFGDLRPPLWTILGAAGFVLLIACTGVSNLLLVRATARQREIALRAALGAGRSRPIRQLRTESAVIALLGGVLGLLLARWSTGLLVAASAVDFKSFIEIGVDPLVIGLMALVSLIVAMVSGLVPAWMSSRVRLSETLKEGGKGSAGFGRHRLQASLVIAEVALALVLLIGAGLMIKGFRAYRGTDLGFRTADLLTMRLDVRQERYRGWPTLAFWDLARQLLARVEPLPEVASIVLEGPGVPTDDWSTGYFDVEQSPDRLVEDIVLLYHHVSPGYFSALGIPLLQGRVFSEDDKYQTPFVAIASESLARRFWPGGDAIGKRLKEVSNSPWLEIVGVVADATHAGLKKEEAPGHDLYVPLYQFPPRAPATFNLLVRPRGVSTANLERRLRQEIRSLVPDVPPYDVKTIEQRLDEQAAQDRFLVLLMSLFALLALTLAVIGIYGVISYIATQREREIGIRTALGARRRDVLRLVIGRGAGLALAGIALGVAAALFLGRWLRSFLFGVDPVDPLILAGTSLLLLAVVVVASYIPARRAARIEPSRVLRIE